MIDRNCVPLVYVWIGDEFPNWGYAAIKLAIKLSKAKVILICESSISVSIPHLTIIRLETFYQPINNQWLKNVVNLRSAYRDGFWIKTTERLSVLSQFATRYAVTKFFHAELDNLIFDLSGLSPTLDFLGSGMFCPRDALDRGAASLVYVNNLAATEELVTTLTSGEIKFESDMKLLGHLLNTSTIFYTLPNEAYLEGEGNTRWPSLSPSETHGIFDAASVGQYVLGIDPRNTGIISRNGPNPTITNACCDFSRVTFELNLADCRMLLRHRDTGIALNIYNLHIHSKLFSLIENSHKFHAILDNLNSNKWTILKINPMKNRLFRSLEYRFFNR